MNLPTGNSTSISFRLCCDAPRTQNEPWSSVAPLRNRDLPLAGEELARDRLLVSARPPAAVPSATTWPPCSPAPGPHVHEMVGGAHHLLVVLDHEHGVAEVAQPLERPDQLPVVALVEPDRRLVEDVEDADELRADLRREPQPLRLAAGERRRCAVELQVADADVVEERQPLADLLDDPRADQLLGLASARASRGTRSRG